MDGVRKNGRFFEPLLSVNVSRAEMTMSCCPHNVSTLALNVSRRVVLLSVNVSWENGCLQAEPFMFASSYN